MRPTKPKPRSGAERQRDYRMRKRNAEIAAALESRAVPICCAVWRASSPRNGWVCPQHRDFQTVMKRTLWGRAAEARFAQMLADFCNGNAEARNFSVRKLKDTGPSENVSLAEHEHADGIITPGELRMLEQHQLEALITEIPLQNSD